MLNNTKAIKCVRVNPHWASHIPDRTQCRPFSFSSQNGHQQREHPNISKREQPCEKPERGHRLRLCRLTQWAECSGGASTKIQEVETQPDAGAAQPGRTRSEFSLLTGHCTLRLHNLLKTGSCFFGVLYKGFLLIQRCKIWPKTFHSGSLIFSL